MAARDTLYGACQGAVVPEFLDDAMDEATYAEILASSRDAGWNEEADRTESSYALRCCAGLCGLMNGRNRIGSSLSCSCCGRMVDQVLVDEGTDHGVYSEAELKLRQDMAANKVVWYADYWKDMWCFTKNTNPVVALCYSHPLHPISRKERIFITVLQSVFLMMVSSAIPRAQLCVAEDRACSTAITWDDQLGRVCCVAEHVGLVWFLENMSLGLNLGGSIYALVVNFIFAQILFQFGANCACGQFLRRDARRCLEFLGHLLMAAIFVLMLLPTWQFMDYNIYHHTLGIVMVTFLTSKPLSILLTTVVQTILFSILWFHDCSGAPEQEHERFYVTASDYQAMVKRRAAVAKI